MCKLERCLKNDFPAGKSRTDTLMVSCTNVTIDYDAQQIISQDCVNGTWFGKDFNGGQTNYSHLTEEYFNQRDDEDLRVQGIDYEQDIIIIPRTK